MSANAQWVMSLLQTGAFRSAQQLTMTYSLYFLAVQTIANEAN